MEQARHPPEPINEEAAVVEANAARDPASSDSENYDEDLEDNDEDFQDDYTKPSAPAPAVGLAAAIARAREIRQDPLKTHQSIAEHQSQTGKS